MKLFSAVADVLLPRYCKVCGRRLSVGEQHLCAPCLLRLPLLEYDGEQICRTEELLLGVTPLVHAASLFRYEKESDYRKILYHLKYYDHPEVGRYLAACAALRLREKGFFDGIDLIVPVPLSSRKLRARGYNQCDFIAEGLSQVTGIAIERGAVARRVSNQVQAMKGRIQRWSNAEGIFSVTDASRLDDRHLLVVDDVITTGATVCSLIDTISAAADVRVSVFTLAVAE